MPVRIEPWSAGDLPLLERLLGDPAMMEHLGGPESPEKLADRQSRYERADSGMFKILDSATGEPVGSTGYWEKAWRDMLVHELGWSVLPEHQGRGLAVAGTALVLDRARAEGRHRFAHAFPSVENGASNAICRRLGFALVEACDVEYPPGHLMRCHDWRLDLEEGATARAAR